jgi:hypothetical protein
MPFFIADEEFGTTSSACDRSYDGKIHSLQLPSRPSPGSYPIGHCYKLHLLRTVPAETEYINKPLRSHRFLFCIIHQHQQFSSHYFCYFFQILPYQTNKSYIMSAPNVDKPNEGIVGQISNSVKNAANYVSETVQGNAATASKEANKEQAKGHAGDTSLTGRASGALDAASDKLNEAKHDSAARANKEGI